MEQIRLIESKYDVEKIRAHGHQVWPLIRFSLSAYFQSEVQPFRERSLGIRKILTLCGQFFYGFPAYFGKYDYISISDSSERKYVEGKWTDKSIDYIIENLPNTLLIELPLPSHYKKSKIPSRFVASKLPLYALEWIYTTFLGKIRIENEDIIIEILKELNISFNYRNVLRKNLGQYKIGQLLCKVYKPKGLILQPSYTNIGFVKAFKDARLKVVEVQHGLISSSHEAYNVFKKFDATYFPDYFLSYGEREKEFFKRSNYVASYKNVVPVGHYYLDVINESKKSATELIPELQHYSMGISITGQNLPMVEERLIEFMMRIAHHKPQICFIYIPRNSQSAIYGIKHLPQNWITVSDRDTYQIIKLTTYHTTIFSTCAVEALALGTPNILVNIDGLAKSHLSETLADSNSTIFVETAEEYINVLDTFVPSEREMVSKSNSDLIVPGYKKNILDFLQKTFE